MDDVPEHAHCRVCRKVCPEGSDTCSKACRLKREGQLQSRKNNYYLLYALAAVVIVLFVLSYARL